MLWLEEQRPSETQQTPLQPGLQQTSACAVYLQLINKEMGRQMDYIFVKVLS